MTLAFLDTTALAWRPAFQRGERTCRRIFLLEAGGEEAVFVAHPRARLSPLALSRPLR